MKEKIPSLDGIRAVAIASVIVLHLTQRYGKTLLVPDGVGLFFVLSGYLITFLLLREKVSKGRVNLAEFYLRRTFRIPRMDSLGVGCFLALAEGTALFERIYAKVSSLWWVAALSFCVGTPFLLSRSPQISHAVGLSLDAAMMGFFILWAARNPETIVGRFLNNRVVAEVGVLSYSIYLWQTFFIHPDTGVRYLNQMPLGLFCIVIAALLSRVLVEKPFFAIRDRVLRSRRARLSIGNVKQALN